MDIEQTMNILPDSALAESVEGLKAALSSQTTLIYVLIVIAALSLIIAIAAMRSGRRTNDNKAPALAAAPLAPAAMHAVSHDGAVAAAITAAIACMLSQEGDGRANEDYSGGFIVRRIRRV